MWQAVSNTKKKDKNTSNMPIKVLNIVPKSDIKVLNTKSVPNNVTQNSIKYTVEFIYSFEQIHKEQQMSYELSVKFDKINEMFKTSTQYIASKIKVNYNQNNHNKWEQKKDTPKSIINIVCGGLNKITDDNYNVIIEEIMVDETMVLDDLEKISERIINKCINETQFLQLYVKVIKHIMFNKKWIVLDANSVPTTFRKIFLNQLELRFENLINDVKNMKYDVSETELIIIHNKARNGLILIIIELYKSKIIGNQLIRYIFKNLENVYESTECIYEQFLEYWLVLLIAITNIWKDSETQYLNEQIEYIIKKKDNLSLKLQFLLEDLIEKLNKSKFVIEIKEVVQEVQSVVETYDMIILSVEEYETVDEWFDGIKNNLNKDNFLTDLLKLTLNYKEYSTTVINILKYLLEIKYVLKNDIKNRINNIRSNNDYSEYRYFERNLEEYLTI